MATGYLSQAELVGRLCTLGTDDFFFIDECHQMKIPVQEMLFDAIDRLRVPVVNGSTASNASQEEKSDGTDIKAFSLLLATDRPGALPTLLLNG